MGAIVAKTVLRLDELRVHFMSIKSGKFGFVPDFEM
jgi:hypothetical protein